MMLIVLDIHSFVDVVTNSSTELFVFDGDADAVGAIKAFVLDRVARALVLRGDFDCVNEAKEEALNRFGVMYISDDVDESDLESVISYCEFYATEEDFVAKYKRQGCSDEEITRYFTCYAKYSVLSNLRGKILVFGTYDNSIPYEIFEQFEFRSDCLFREHLG